MISLALAASLSLTAPELPPLPPIKREAQVVYVDRAGAVLGVRGGRYGPPVDIAKLPAHVPAAFIAIQDRRFYEHTGFDAIGIARAIVANAVVRIIKREALRVFTERTAFHCAALGARLPSVTIMDARARWGSCRPGLPGKPAAIRYSWRLALAPYEVADYVAAHECAHLLELNHGPKFWAHVSALVGDERPHRAWLRAEGSRLHAFGR